MTATLTFFAAFGIVKAATNFFAGTLSDRYSRKPVLVAGWLIGIPVPLLLMRAPTWSWVVFANVRISPCERPNRSSETRGAAPRTTKP